MGGHVEVEMNDERNERKTGEEWAACVVVGVRIMENSVPVTGVQNGSPHL